MQKITYCKRITKYVGEKSEVKDAWLFLQVIKETVEFENSLRDMGYLRGDSTALLKYVKNINCHFASKKCKDVIVAARKLMTSKMHNTVKVSSPVTIPALNIITNAHGHTYTTHFYKVSQGNTQDLKVLKSI